MKAGPFTRALGYFPRLRGRWSKGMAWILPASLLEAFAIPLSIREVVAGFDSGGMGFTTIALWAGVIMLMTLAKGFGKYYMRWYVTGASREFERLFRQDLFQHLMRLAPRDLSHLRTGDIMSRSTADIEALRMMLGPGGMYIAQSLIVVPTALCVMLYLDASFTAAMLVPFLGLALIIRIVAPPTQRWSHATQERLADLSTVAQERLSGIRVVKAFATETFSGGVFRGMGETLLESNMRLAMLRGYTTASITAMKELGILVILLVGGWHVVDGSASVADLLTFMMLLQSALWPLIAIGWMLGMYHRAKAGAERLDEVFAIQPSVQQDAQALEPEQVRGELEVRNLSFAWDGAPTLEDVSLHVPAGTTLGITGRTGSGKSTLVQLMTRLVEPPPGTVLLDGVDVRRLSLPFLRRNLGVVPQDTFLFSETIGANIAFAGEHVDEDAVRQAARLARVDTEIEEFAEGYEQLLGERGVTLSGGQRQRTAIARTLAADTPVMILDDCLSAVDSVTEQAILRGLRDALEGRTAVVVSHRVNALALADRIVVLDEGRIVESGTHDELIARGGLYAEIEERQRLEQEIEAL